MKSHELTTSANQNATRPGRGISAGRGKTAGRGTKGQNSRAGGKRRPGFEGGQNPMFKRTPKVRGFKSFREAKVTITTAQIDELGAKVDNTALFEAGLIEHPHVSVKVVDKGELKKKHTVELQAASAGAIKGIEKAGGTFKQTGRPQRPAAKKSE